MIHIDVRLTDNVNLSGSAYCSQLGLLLSQVRLFFLHLRQLQQVLIQFTFCAFAMNE